MKKKKITKAILKMREKRKLRKEYKQMLEEWKIKVIERDNWTEQMTGKKLLTRKECHVHHIISAQSCKRNYPDLLFNINNGILLNYYTHFTGCQSAHKGGFEFVLWLKENKPEQYNYLINYLDTKI